MYLLYYKLLNTSKELINSPDLVFQILIEQSREPLANYKPSGENATLKTLSVCPLKNRLNSRKLINNLNMYSYYYIYT